MSDICTEANSCQSNHSLSIGALFDSIRRETNSAKMGKSKKCKPNGFSEFMFEFINRKKKEGHDPKKEEYSALAAPHWEKLSPEEKEVYTKRAKQKAEGGARYPTTKKASPKKYTSHGILISDMERAAEEKVERERNAVLRIKRIVELNYLGNALGTTPFNFIMANYFVATMHGDYYPAELALVQFTFQDGIIQTYHAYLNPQALPTGYAFEALELAKTHRLPVPPNAIGETDFEKVYDNLLAFLKGGVETAPVADGQPKTIPVFIHDNHMTMIKSVLARLPEDPASVDRDIDVLSLNTLFNELQNVDALEQRSKLSIHISNMLLNADRFDSAQNIACELHENEDAALQCAVSVCKRWVYTVCDHICYKKLGLPLVAGVHLPTNAAASVVQPSTDDDGEKKNAFVSALDGPNRNVGRFDQNT